MYETTYKLLFKHAAAKLGPNNFEGRPAAVPFKFDNDYMIRNPYLLASRRPAIS